MDSCDDVVGDEWPMKLEGRVEAVKPGVVELPEFWRNGAFWARSSRTRCCKRSFSIFSSRNVFNLGVNIAREFKVTRQRGAYIAVFLPGYVFAVAKKHLQLSSPSI